MKRSRSASSCFEYSAVISRICVPTEKSSCCSCVSASFRFFASSSMVSVDTASSYSACSSSTCDDVGRLENSCVASAVTASRSEEGRRTARGFTATGALCFFFLLGADSSSLNCLR